MPRRKTDAASPDPAPAEPAASASPAETVPYIKVTRYFVSRPPATPGIHVFAPGSEIRDPAKMEEALDVLPEGYYAVVED